MNREFLFVLALSFSSLIKCFVLTFFLLAKRALCVDHYYLACREPRTCGDGQNISFPFYLQGQQPPFCGYPGFNISCSDNRKPILSLPNNDYVINEIFYNNQSVHISNAEVFNTSTTCVPPIQNLSLPREKFELPPNHAELFLLYNCNSSLFINNRPLLQYKINCFGGNETSNLLALYGHDANLDYVSIKCKNSVVAPVGMHGYGNGQINDAVEGLLGKGFVLKWIANNCSECKDSGGKCGFDETTYHFRCFCPDRPHAWHCRDSEAGTAPVLTIALVASAAGVGVLILLAFCLRKKFLSDNSIVFWKKRNENYQNIEAFLKTYGSLAPKRYSYMDLKKLTDSFKNKLGQGGYGCVYKGELPDGRSVAVKVLNESKGDGQEFINEVASISQTSHVNVVTLQGFCFEGRKRALVYEFVPNGSLEKFIYEEDTAKDRQLKWETLLQIAVGIARGLEYLHRGCNTRILHFDIKPHNILLDENFCPKISDFGLSKICPKRESIISMLGARGTPGYIAPEVFCRNIGGISHKSDVYSYGMMVLEMVGGRKNINVRADHTSEIYFPHWVYNRLELDEELGLQGILSEQDEDSAKKMVMVSLWCIQTDPSIRPSMSRVVEMLTVNLEALQIPPKPFLSPPPRSPSDSSTTPISFHCDSVQ